MGTGSGGGKPKAKATSASVAAKKASGKHVCFDCGQAGHWAGDAECKHPGAGLARPKPKAGPLDSACSRTCAGTAWLEDYVDQLATAPDHVKELVTTKIETESFRLGNGGVLPSTLRWRIPLVFSGELICVWVSAVPVPSLGLLLGRDVLDGLRGVLDFSAKSLVCKVFGEALTALEKLSAGHLALKLIPEAWPELGKGRRRKLGPDGVLEVYLGCREWASRLMRVHARPQSADALLEGHHRNVTEASLELGRLAYDFHSVLTVLAQSNMSDDVPSEDFDSSPTASTSVPSLDHGDSSGCDQACADASSWKRGDAKRLARAGRGGRVHGDLHGSMAPHGGASVAPRKVELLWFVRQPGLRFLPWPYPSVFSVAQWRTQAEAMIESRCYPRKWLARASFTASNLSLLAWSRGRVGLSLAFREDPILVGVLMARQRPGRMTQLKNAAIKEEAEKLAKEKDRLKVARALLGPRGGLPTLKSDLIKLAQLLHTEVGEKETVPNIRTKLKPVAAALCQQVSYEQATEHMKSSTTALPSSAPSSSTTAPTSMATSFGATPVRSQGPVPMSAPLAGNASTSPPMATPRASSRQSTLAWRQWTTVSRPCSTRCSTT